MDIFIFWANFRRPFIFLFMIFSFKYCLFSFFLQSHFNESFPSLLFNFFHIQESVAIHRWGVTCKVTPYLNFILALAICLYVEAHNYLDLGIVNNLNSLEARLVYNFPLLTFGLPTTVYFLAIYCLTIYFFFFAAFFSFCFFISCMRKSFLYLLVLGPSSWILLLKSLQQSLLN